MNFSRWQGKWKQLRGALTQAWGRLTNDRLLVFIGEQDVVNGRIQERVGRLRASGISSGRSLILPFRNYS